MILLSDNSYLMQKGDKGETMMYSVQTVHRLGNYRMPFAWAARPLFRLYSNELDTSSDFPAIYRQEGNKIRDDEILKLLSEYRK